MSSALTVTMLVVATQKGAEEIKVTWVSNQRKKRLLPIKSSSLNYTAIRSDDEYLGLLKLHCHCPARLGVQKGRRTYTEF